LNHVELHFYKSDQHQHDSHFFYQTGIRGVKGLIPTFCASPVLYITTILLKIKVKHPKTKPCHRCKITKCVKHFDKKMWLTFLQKHVSEICTKAKLT
jgi:hypothetical protein